MAKHCIYRPRIANKLLSVAVKRSQHINHYALTVTGVYRLGGQIRKLPIVCGSIVEIPCGMNGRCSFESFLIVPSLSGQGMIP